MSSSAKGPWLPSVEEMEEFLKKETRGQDHAISKVVPYLGYFRSGFKDFKESTRKKPIGVFIFLGPSQVGKTHLGKMLGKMFYGTAEAVTLLPMENYKERHQVAQLIGAPPGYVGHGELTEFSTKKLHSKLPGRKHLLQSKADQKPETKKDAADATGSESNENSFYFLLGLKEQELDLLLAELDVIERSLADLDEKLAELDKTEKTTKDLQIHEEIKEQILFTRRIVKVRKEEMLFSYNQSLVNLLMERDRQKKAKKNFEIRAKSIPILPATKEPSLPVISSTAPSLLPVFQPSLEESPILVVILDEIEKAHPDLWDFLMHAFREGEVPLANGQEVVDFSRTIFIMTSNLGAGVISEILRKKTKIIGMITSKDKSGDIDRAAQKKLDETFKPEFLNRIDEVITFKDLSRQDLLDILSMHLAEFALGLARHFIYLTITPAVRNFLVEKAQLHPETQAQGLLKELKTAIEMPLGKMFSEGKVRQGMSLVVVLENNAVQFQTRIITKPAK